MHNVRTAMCLVFALGLLGVATAQQSAQLVIANVRVFTGARVIDRATITVADGKILSIAATPPARASITIDGTGKTALPGLIDVHVHMLVGITEADTRRFIDNALKERLQAFLRHGVTTVKSASDPTDLIVGIREDLRDGALTGPRLLVVGPSLTARGGHPASTICRGDAWCRANRAAEAAPTPSLQARSQTTAALHRAGVRIVVGTDTRLEMPPGLSTVKEVELLVKAGLSTEAALKAATSVAARHLGLEKEIGTLETGMTADILLVRGDPIRNVGDLHQVDAVVQAGRIVFQPVP